MVVQVQVQGTWSLSLTIPPTATTASMSPADRSHTANRSCFWGTDTCTNRLTQFREKRQ